MRENWVNYSKWVKRWKWEKSERGIYDKMEINFFAENSRSMESTFFEKTKILNLLRKFGK